MNKNCHFENVSTLFQWGKYKNFALGDIIECNAEYIYWCITNLENISFSHKCIQEIKNLYPNFLLPIEFSTHIREFDHEENITPCNRNDFNIDDIEEDDINQEESRTFERYAGSWAQDVEGYSDEDIDTIFDGDPNAYWNID